MSHLLIPMNGPMQVLDNIHNPFLVLDQVGAQGPAVKMALTDPGDERHLYFRLDEMPPQNNRARWVLADLCGLHVVITGPALITNLEPDTIKDLMERP